MSPPVLQLTASIDVFVSLSILLLFFVFVSASLFVVVLESVFVFAYPFVLVLVVFSASAFVLISPATRDPPWSAFVSLCLCLCLCLVFCLTCCSRSSLVSPTASSGPSARWWRIFICFRIVDFPLSPFQYWIGWWDNIGTASCALECLF